MNKLICVKCGKKVDVLEYLNKNTYYYKEPHYRNRYKLVCLKCGLLHCCFSTVKSAYNYQLKEINRQLNKAKKIVKWCEQLKETPDEK